MAVRRWINRIHGFETMHFPSDMKAKRVNETTTIIVSIKRVPKRFLGVCYSYRIEQIEVPISSLFRRHDNEHIESNVLSHQERLDYIVDKKVTVGESIVVNGRQIPTFKIQ
jgi:hypothetical protein